jgi:prolyl-tRNA synthetase
MPRIWRWQPALSPLCRKRPPAEQSMKLRPETHIRLRTSAPTSLSTLQPALKTLVVPGLRRRGRKERRVNRALFEGRSNVERNQNGLNLPAYLVPLEFADDEVIEATLGCKPGAIGPSSKCAFSYADPSVLGLVNFVCGANKEDTHFSRCKLG